MSSSNTSKTAHVMNLLSKNRVTASAEPAPAPEAAAPAQETEIPTAKPETAHTAPVAPIISSITADAAVSSQIKDALEAELKAETAPAPTPAPVQEAPAQQSAPVRQTTPVQQTAPVQQAAAPVQEAPVVQEAPPVREAPVEPDMPEPFSREPLQPKGLAYINVMQILVEEKADEYMKMFGICCCDKCRVDVRAYALNHLPPKYVVLSEHERVPRLTVYESRFLSDITAQLIQACKQVMLTPHHSRKDN